MLLTINNNKCCLTRARVNRIRVSTLVHSTYTHTPPTHTPPPHTHTPVRHYCPYNLSSHGPLHSISPKTPSPQPHLFTPYKSFQRKHNPITRIFLHSRPTSFPKHISLYLPIFLFLNPPATHLSLHFQTHPKPTHLFILKPTHNLLISSFFNPPTTHPSSHTHLCSCPPARRR